MSSLFNRILEEEVSGYWILDKQVIPITNEAELSAIKKAHTTKYDAVNIHISKALALYSNRRLSDYEKSISAVGAICCIICGITGAQATLGNAIKKDKGVHIHFAMEKAFACLYGYISDENGIRHGGIDFTSAPAEDAKYMLISCFVFINYLIEKWTKIKM